MKEPPYLLCCGTPRTMQKAHHHALWRERAVLPLPESEQRRVKDIIEKFSIKEILTDNFPQSDLPRGIKVIGQEEFERTGVCPRERWPEIMVFLLTSGTSGHPKSVKKTAQAICGEAEALLKLFDGLSFRPGAVVTTVPVEHMYGYMFGFWMPQMAGLPVPERRVVMPADVRKACQDAGTDKVWLITTPTHLERYVKVEGGFRPLEGIICATSPLSVPLAARVVRTFGVPILEIYGSTETGALAWRLWTGNEGNAPLWRPLPGYAVEQARHDGTLWRLPFESEAKFVADRIIAGRDGRFELKGRTDDVVKVAGKRTTLSTLESVLQSLSGVREGAFVCLPRREHLAAAVVLEPGWNLETVAKSLAERIDPVFMPRPFRAVARLPRSETGKLRRADLIELLSEEDCKG